MLLQFKLENILRTDKTQTITGSKSFPEVNVAGMLIMGIVLEEVAVLCMKV